MEKVTVKIELDRDYITAMMRLLGSKLTDEQWEKMRERECIVGDEDFEEKATEMRFAFSAIAIAKFLKE